MEDRGIVTTVPYYLAGKGKTTGGGPKWVILAMGKLLPLQFHTGNAAKWTSCCSLWIKSQAINSLSFPNSKKVPQDHRALNGTNLRSK